MTASLSSPSHPPSGPEKARVPDSGSGSTEGDASSGSSASGWIAEFLLVATPFLLLALFLFLEWWVRS